MLQGRPTDRLCTCAWQHMPMVDKNPKDLAKATIDFTENNRWDFVKMMYNTSFFYQDFGMEVAYSKDQLVWRPEIIKHAAVHVNDFLSMRPADPTKGNLGRQLEATKYVVDHFKGAVPVVGTLFTPLSFYKDMLSFCRGDAAFAAMRYNPKELHHALGVITETSLAFTDELAKLGADGMFIAGHFCDSSMPDDWFEEFCRPYDLEVTRRADDTMWFNILHIHGVHDLAMDRFLSYPCQALSWEDIIAGPDSGFTMADMRKKSDKIFIGGIEMQSDYYSEDNDREAVKSVLLNRGRDAVTAAGFDKLILAPGCGAPQDIPPYRFTLQHEVALMLTREFGR
jgi:uroporphyrinogen decarboxylase